MSEDDDFGPWVLHNGKGCPCVGQMVELVYNGWPEFIGLAKGSGSWTYGDANDRCTWSRNGIGKDGRFYPIIRYRIKKPRALLDLIQMVADLPAPVVKQPAPGVIA